MKPVFEEYCRTKIELEEMPNGTWQVREINIFEYTDPLAARNKIEEYMYDKMNNRENKEWD